MWINAVPLFSVKNHKLYNNNFHAQFYAFSANYHRRFHIVDKEFCNLKNSACYLRVSSISECIGLKENSAIPDMTRILQNSLQRREGNTCLHICISREANNIECLIPPYGMSEDNIPIFFMGNATGALKIAISVIILACSWWNKRFFSILRYATQLGFLMKAFMKRNVLFVNINKHVKSSVVWTWYDLRKHRMTVYSMHLVNSSIWWWF